MPKTKLIIFDLDGTIVDAYPAIIKSFNHTMRALHYPDREARVIRRAVGWGDQNLLSPFVEKKDLKRAVLIYRQHHKNALVKYSRLFPHAKMILGYLKNKGYQLAVASNRPSKFSQILIRHLKLAEYFSYVLCADKLKNIKPDPEILYKIMKKFSLKPAGVIYVGDMTIDAQAGRRAGIRTVIVTTGSSLRDEIAREKPYRLIARLSQLRRIL